MNPLALTLLIAACSHVSPIKVEPVAALSPSPVFTPPETRGRTVVTDTEIEILDTISFVGNTAQLSQASTRILDAIAGTLQGNPSILLLEVRGHSDWEETDRTIRAELSIQRAEAVVGQLIVRGVDAARLSTYGASDDEPLSLSDPVVNRRIELVILERASD